MSLSSVLHLKCSSPINTFSSGTEQHGGKAGKGLFVCYEKGKVNRLMGGLFIFFF